MLFRRPAAPAGFNCLWWRASCLCMFKVFTGPWLTGQHPTSLSVAPSSGCTCRCVGLCGRHLGQDPALCPEDPGHHPNALRPAALPAGADCSPAVPGWLEGPGAAPEVHPGAAPAPGGRQHPEPLQGLQGDPGLPAGWHQQGLGGGYEPGWSVAQTAGRGGSSVSPCWQ